MITLIAQAAAVPEEAAATTAVADTTPPVSATEKAPAEASGDGILDKFLETFADMGSAAAEKAPYILIGLSIFLIGFIIAKILRGTVQTVTARVGLDEAAQKMGVSELLSKIGVRDPLSKFLSTILFYILILFFIKVSADFMGISDLSKFIDNLIAFFPKLIVAFLILMAGLLAADIVRKMIARSLDNVGIEYGGLIANFAYGLLAVMILTVVLSQVGIQTDLLNAAVKIFLAAGSLAIALAMGLGLRPIARNVVSGVYARDSFPPGSRLEIKDTPATVVEVGPVSTRLENEYGEYFVIPNSQMVNQVLKGTLRSSDKLEKKRG